MTVAVWWIRRDLRLADNPALAYGAVVPPPREQSLLGIKIGETYPLPIVDRAIVKARTLAAYRASQEGSA